MSTPAETLLAKAIRAEAGNLKGDSHIHAAELIRVLARLVEGKTIDQAMGAPGNWGYGLPIGDALFALLKEPEPARHTYAWHYVTDKLPDADSAVLVATAASGQPGEAVHSGDGVFLWAGSDIAIEGVYAWADLPEIPEKKGGE